MALAYDFFKKIGENNDLEGTFFLSRDGVSTIWLIMIIFAILKIAFGIYWIKMWQLK